jgi:Arc/MetJ-type ribon-helix-helix transcriptional regulator
LEGYPPNVLARTGFKKDVTLKTQAVLSPDRPRGMVPGMATRKITITLQDNQIQEIQSLVERGQARNVSSFVQHAVSIALHDAAGWQEMLESALIESGGPLTKEERAWADRLLSAKSSKRRSRRGKVA